MYDAIITFWNALPDAIHMAAYGTDTWEVLRFLAKVTGQVLFEDGSIG